MRTCQIPYIPERLARNGRPIIEVFEIGEFLYMRCRPESVQNPYKAISITELSHNRSGLLENILCNPEDVLYSIKNEEPFEKHVDKVVCTLEIKSLNDQQRYRKSYNEVKNDQNYEGVIELFHEPEECMYPHSVFRIWVNNQVITYDNHDSILKKLNKIRNYLKEEIASMIVQKQVSQNDNPLSSNQEVN